MSEPFNPYAPPEANIIVEPESLQGLRLASRWRRLGASIIDTVIVSAVFVPVMFLGGYFQRTMERAQHGVTWSPEVLLWGVAGIVIVVALNWHFLGKGQTIGKSLLNMRIVRKDGTPAGRSVIILKRLLPIQLIAQIPLVGALVAVADSLCIFRSERNTLHDDLADTKVVDLRAD